MPDELQLYEKLGTISLNWIKNINSEIRIYKKLKKRQFMVPDSSKAELQNEFSTRIMGPISMNSGPYGSFFPLIPMVQKIFGSSEST